MTRNVLTFAIALVACALMAAPSAQAQCDNCGGGRKGIGSRLGGGGGLFHRGARSGSGGGGSFDQDGMTLPTSEHVGPATTIKAAVHDRFSPHSFYAYNNHGLEAANIHQWNNSQQNVYAWHGGYQNWRFGTPTALVVPPTATTQSSYAWGVGQTRSTPIHHQFGRGGAAMVGGGNGSGFQQTPYWPSSTNQFGVYPVRGPW